MDILITGGLGFLGSNLATRLSKDNHKITIVDNYDPRYGANEFNLHDANMANIKVVRGDVRDGSLMKSLLQSKMCVYHLAAQVSYIDSLMNPLEDLEINCSSMLILLEALRQLGQTTRFIFASSRMVYGKITDTPVTEAHPLQPTSLYGIHKSANERYLGIYSREFGIPYTVVRITNPYGIKQQIRHSKYSLVGWFVRLAMEDKTIKVFGKGNQRRDYIYASDITEILSRIPFNESSINQVYNLGVGKSTVFRDMVSEVVGTVGSGKIEYVDWPKDYEAIETGDFEVSIDKLRRDFDWYPEVTLSEGIRRTYQYYRTYFKDYL